MGLSVPSRPRNYITALANKVRGADANTSRLLCYTAPMTAKSVSAYLARIGAKGGQVKGPAKSRGARAYYQRLQKLAAAAKRKKAEAKP